MDESGSKEDSSAFIILSRIDADSRYLPSSNKSFAFFIELSTDGMFGAQLNNRKDNNRLKKYLFILNGANNCLNIYSKFIFRNI